MVDARDEARAGSGRCLPLSAGDDANPALEGVAGREDECPFVPLRPGTERLLLGSRPPLEFLRLSPFCLFSPCGAVAGVDPIAGALVPVPPPDAVPPNLSSSSFVNLALPG
jgi:hypothetical protein